MNSKTNEYIYGIHSIQSVLDKNPKQILEVYIVYKPLDLRFVLLVNQLNKYDISVRKCPRRWLDIKVKGAVHQGIVARIVQTSCLQEKNLLDFLITCKENPFLLVLDGITDPHNLGACLRSADAAGVHMVIAPRNRSVCLNGTVRKVASGAIDHVPFVQVTNLVRTLKLLKEHNIWIVGTVLDSNRVIFDTKLVGPLALVMGSEGFGIRELTKKNCNELINIPMLGVTASLNVSVATGICLFEALRQRRCLLR